MRFNEEEERSRASDGRNAQQEAVARTEEGNRKQGRPGAMGRQGCVYFIETSDGAFVKIGYSVNVPRRFNQIGVLMPGLRLLGSIPGTPETEYSLHKKFAVHRETGEWFRKTEDLKRFIVDLRLIPPAEPEPDPMSFLDESRPKNPAAVALGRLGGAKKVPKGLSQLSPEQRSVIAKQGAATRWGNARKKAKKPNGGKADG